MSLHWMHVSAAYALVDGGCRVEVIPSRGALVTRMTVDGVEYLLDPRTPEILAPCRASAEGLPSRSNCRPLPRPFATISPRGRPRLPGSPHPGIL